MRNNLNFLDFIFLHSAKSRELDFILPGASSGIDSPFIQRIINTSVDRKRSVLAANFRFHNEKSGKPSIDLKEELKMISEHMKFIQVFNFQHINIIAKSLGGIIASRYLSMHGNESEFSITVLGYVVGSMQLRNFLGDIKIIQGSKDKFGNIEDVKKDMKNALSKKIKYYSIEGSDHSFREHLTMEPKFESQAIELIYN